MLIVSVCVLSVSKVRSSVDCKARYQQLAYCLFLFLFNRVTGSIPGFFVININANCIFVVRVNSPRSMLKGSVSHT